MDKTLQVRITGRLSQKIDKIVEQEGYKDESDFVRSALYEYFRMYDNTFRQLLGTTSAEKVRRKYETDEDIKIRMMEEAKNGTRV